MEIIEKDIEFLTEYISTVQFGGGTALGPALLVALLVIRQYPGSDIVLCTDGEATGGIGYKNPEWFTEFGNECNKAGIRVSTLAIQGDKCELEHVGKVAEISGGKVLHTAANALAAHFQMSLRDNVLATDVQMTVVLPKGFQFANGSNVKQVSLGNVSSGKILLCSFCPFCPFCCKKKSQKKHMIVITDTECSLAFSQKEPVAEDNSWMQIRVGIRL